MMGVWSERFARTEYVLVCVLALVLPILEAPKNLAVFLLLLTWVVHRIVARDVALRRPDWVEASLLFILVTCILSTVFNWPLVNGLKGFKDTLIQVFVFWLIYRAGYSDRQYLIIAAMMAVGVLIGLGWGVLDVAQGRLGQLQFHSAGIVTQSSIYLGVVLAVAFSVAWFRPAALPEIRFLRSPITWWLFVAIMLIGLFLMASRGAILAVLATCIIYAVVIKRRAVWLSFAGAMVVVTVITVMLPDRFGQSRWLSKTQEMSTSGQLVLADLERVDNWRIAIARIKQGDALVLGIGPRNFAAIDSSTMEMDPPLRIRGRLNHAHNLFLNKLVEEGIVGLSAMLFFFGLVVMSLVRDYGARVWRRWQWGAAIGALVVPVVAGSVNTPWYQEHALLAMMVLAVYVSSRPKTV